MKVKAIPGLRVPREDNARRYIEQVAVDVVDSPYYQRQIIDGDLIIVAADVAAPVADALDNAAMPASDDATKATPKKGN